MKIRSEVSISIPAEMSSSKNKSELRERVGQDKVSGKFLHIKGSYSHGTNQGHEDRQNKEK